MSTAPAPAGAWATGTPDLAMTGLSTLPYGQGGGLLQATLVNQGTLTTINGFFTDVCVNHMPAGAGDYSGTVRFLKGNM